MIKFGSLKIDPSEIGSRGNAILGIRDSGKTYTATLLAERLFDSGIPFIAFDPIGVWRFLRVPGNGRGYPVVVAGGQEGDLPLTVAGAPEIVRAAMANGVSLVIDLFDIRLSKADWKRIVTACVRVLLHENSRHGLRHVFIEEAAEFAPQRIGPDQGQVYAEIEKLARMGGNSRLGYTLINQRAEEVNKAVLELCDNLFLHRQKGRNSLNALAKWLDIGNVKDGKAIIETLSTLPSGQCWAWLGGAEHAELIKVPTKNSLHPDRRLMRGENAVIAPKAIDVGKFVETMRGTLGDIEQEAKTLEEVKADNTKLKRELAAAQRAAGTTEITELRRALDELMQQRNSLCESLRSIYAIAQSVPNEIVRIPRGSQSESPGSIPRRDPERMPKTAPARPAAAAASAAGQTGDLPAGERAVLTVIAQHPDGCTREQLSVIAGYKRSTRNLYLQRLASRGFISRDDTVDLIMATDEGIAALGDFEPLPTGVALRDYWLDRLPEGERKLLTIICDFYPAMIGRDKLGDEAGYKRSTRNLYLQKLASRKLISADSVGVRASRILFD